MIKAYLIFLWFVLSLIPAAFLFHFFEYKQYMQGASLFLTSLLFTLITGFLSSVIKVPYVILLNALVTILSLLLASKFISDDSSWFKPIGRDATIIGTAIIFLMAQLLVRKLSRKIFAITNK